MTALVIGANGHIGAHLVRALVAGGHRVRALVRPTGKVDGLVGLDLDLVHGNVLDPHSLRQAMDGCDTAFHLAAPTRLGSDLARTIVDGTRNVMECAKDSGLRRIVYTSSAVTIGFSPSPEIVLDEETRRPVTASAYHVAKAQAEEYVLQFGRERRAEVVVVNPSTVVGPLDYRTTPSTLAVRRCLEKGLPFAFDSGLTIAPVEDVARGHILAMEKGRNGECYILGGERVSIRAYFGTIAECCGRSKPMIQLPRLALVAAGAAFSIMRKCGVEDVPFDLRQAKSLVGQYAYYSSTKAARELDYTWKSAAKAVEGYVQWAKAEDAR